MSKHYTIAEVRVGKLGEVQKIMVQAFDRGAATVNVNDDRGSTGDFVVLADLPTEEVMPFLHGLGARITARVE